MAACLCDSITKVKYKFKKGTDKTIANIIVTTGAADVNGKTIAKIFSNGVHKQDKYRACEIKNTLVKIKTGFSWARAGAPLQEINDYLAILCPLINVKSTKEADCLLLLAKDADKQAEKDNCEPPKEWSDSRCKCYTPRKKKDQTALETEIVGCLDPTADNYWCKENPGGCIDNKPPKHILRVDCMHSIKVDLKNDYNFCNNKFGCYPDDAYSIDAPYEVIKYKNDGSLPAGHFESISAATKQVIETINKKITATRNGFLFLESAKGFYTTDVWSPELVDDFAKALAVAELKTKNDDKDDTFPFQRVTIFNPASEIIGQFSIYHGTDRNGETDGITELKNHTSTSTLNYRLQFEIGTPLLYPEDEARTNKALKDDMNIIKYTVVDGKIAKVSVNEEKVGLINILKEEPIGLVKLLK